MPSQIVGAAKRDNRRLPPRHRAGHEPAMPPAPYLMFDDARAGGAPARRYRDPVAVLEAWTPDDVRTLLADLRSALTQGRHVAGFLSYEAAAAFELHAPRADGLAPLAWFGLFDRFEPVADVAATLPDLAGAWAADPVPQIDYGQYAAMFDCVQALIAAGDIYQANLTFRALVRFVGEPAALYARLRRNARAGWGALINTGADTLLSLSPELFFKLQSDELTCRPMKGTAPRGIDAAADAALAAALAADEKQRAENLMIVDLMRNDLSRVALAGSVAVPERFVVETYPSVHQLVSTVTARLVPERDAIDVLAALFPCGSITGAPKLRAMQVIGEVERGCPRGPYTGTIGWIDPNGDAQFNVAIRTLLIQGDDDYAVLGLGGGIVADSRAADEWNEALTKGRFVTLDRGRFDLIETMMFDPEEGIALLERHLERMKASADIFGFVFDRHHARNELQAATFRLRAPAKVRLLLGASGAIAIETAPPPQATTRLSVAIVPLPVAPSDFRLRHKTSARAFYDDARAASDADEVVFVDPDGCVTEGSFTTVFVERDGMLLTPPLSRGLLPGVLRAELIASGRAREAELTPDDLADGFLVGNAVRGLIPAFVAVAKGRG